jgi:hypothetical protein
VAKTTRRRCALLRFPGVLTLSLSSLSGIRIVPVNQYRKLTASVFGVFGNVGKSPHHAPRRTEHRRDPHKTAARPTCARSQRTPAPSTRMGTSPHIHRFGRTESRAPALARCANLEQAFQSMRTYERGTPLPFDPPRAPTTLRKDRKRYFQPRASASFIRHESSIHGFGCTFERHVDTH